MVLLPAEIANTLLFSISEGMPVAEPVLQAGLASLGLLNRPAVLLTAELCRVPTS